MKNAIIVLGTIAGVLLLVFLLEFGQLVQIQTEIQAVNNSGYQTPEAPKIIPEEEWDDNLRNVMKQFEPVVPGSKLTLTADNGRAIILIDTNLPSDQKPEKWDKILSCLEAAYTFVEGSVSAQINASDGTVLANSSMGRITYNKFADKEFKK